MLQKQDIPASSQSHHQEVSPIPFGAYTLVPATKQGDLLIQVEQPQLGSKSFIFERQIYGYSLKSMSKIWNYLGFSIMAFFTVVLIEQQSLLADPKIVAMTATVHHKFSAIKEQSAVSLSYQSSPNLTPIKHFIQLRDNHR